jgi:adenylyltransferase/sulfurtransferase
MDMSRYSRQTVFEKIGKAGQEKLLASRVAVVGTGALGTVIAANLCRAGVGYIRLIDRDYVELSNLQRQTLFDEEDARRQTPKAVAACEHLQKANSQVTLEAAAADVNSATIEQLCGGVDLILDGSDNFELRQLVNEYSVQNNASWIYGAALGSNGATMNFIPGKETHAHACGCTDAAGRSPDKLPSNLRNSELALASEAGGKETHAHACGKTPCFRCVFPRLPQAGSLPSCASAGVLNMITGLIACVQSAEAVKFLVGSPDLRRNLFMVDLWQNSADYVEVAHNAECPVCVRKEFDFLGKAAGTRSIPLCGKNAVQIIPATARQIDFVQLAGKLRKAGNVEYSRFMLRFEGKSAAFQLFPDGRAIIQRTGDENAAKSVYTEYIG